MKRRALVSALCAAMTFASSLFAQDYKFVKFPAGYRPLANNASGQVAGSIQPGGFLWSRIGGFQSLPDLGGGAATTLPTAINDSGIVVGQSNLSSGVAHAFLWTAAGGMQDLGSLAGGNSRATAINASGEVVGISSTPDGSSTEAFFWSQTTGTLPIDFPPNKYAYPVAINSAGVVIECYGSCYEWSQERNVTPLDFSNYGGHETASSINDSSQAVGDVTVNIYHNNGQQGAALWALDGSLQYLGALPGDLYSSALLVNRAGHVAGYSRHEYGTGLLKSFFWTPTAGMIDIGLLPNHTIAPSIPAGLNNRDQVVGENGAAYFWSATLGMVPVVGANNPVFNSLNDAGQFLSYTGVNSGVAIPVMHVTLTASPNPSVAGQKVIFTAKVNAIVGLPPDGEKVTFMNGKTVLGTGVLKSGVARFSTIALKTGTTPVSANYAGDTNYYPNKSAVVEQIVNP